MSSASPPQVASTTAAETSNSSVSLYLLVATLAAGAYYLYQQTRGDSWTRYGVKQPKLPFFYFFDDDFRARFSQLLNQYGDIVGFQNRNGLWLLTSNFNLMKHILVKDFNNFVERAENLRSKSPFGKSLFFAKRGEWKRHRQIVSPTFSTGKLRNIAKSVDATAQNLVKYLEQNALSGKLVPIKDAAAQFTGEIIAKTAFGLNVNFIGQEDAEFLTYARTMISPLSGRKRFIFMILDLIPGAINFCRKMFPAVQMFDPINLEGNEYFKSTLRYTISERRKQEKEGKVRSPDFLDLILKANDDVKAGKMELEDDEEEGVNEDEKASKSWEAVVNPLTEEEILGHSMLIIFAGMETTATTLQLCFWRLAQHPDIQDKVFQEIQSVVTSVTPSTEELSRLHFVEQVINETLRMHPPAPLVNRKALETRTYDGVTIPKGASVIIPYYHIMMDPKVYPDPTKFNPGRFSPEEKARRDVMSFVAFGQGPRLCLGMRLAYLELKTALVHVLRRLRVVVNERTEPRRGEECRFKSVGLLMPKKPIMLEFEVREK